MQLELQRKPTALEASIVPHLDSVLCGGSTFDIYANGFSMPIISPDYMQLLDWVGVAVNLHGEFSCLYRQGETTEVGPHAPSAIVGFDTFLLDLSKKHCR